MKSSAFLLVGSVIFNVALAVALTQRPVVRDYFAGASRPAADGTPTPDSAPALVGETDRVSAESWSELTAGDLTDVVARLRAQGVPARLVRHIMSALVSRQFADRHKAIAAAMAARPWWQRQTYEAYSDPKITAMRRQLNHDERDVLYRLLGPESPETEYDRLWAQSHYGNLSPEQTEKFRRINTDYSDLMAEVREQARGIILPEDRNRLAYLEQEKRNDIAKLLSPDDLFEFSLRSSPTAKRLRDQFAAFDGTEDEFRAVFKIYATIDADFGDGHVQNLTAEERRQRRDLIAAANEQVRAVLTPERFALYQLTTDPAYAQTNQFVTELQLPPTVTGQVVSVQRDTTNRMQAIIADKSLSGVQRSTQLSVLAQQANGQLAASLGPDGLASYKAGPGNWLNNLEARAQPRSATPKP